MCSVIVGHAQSIRETMADERTIGHSLAEPRRHRTPTLENHLQRQPSRSTASSWNCPATRSYHATSNRCVPTTCWRTCVRPTSVLSSRRMTTGARRSRPSMRPTTSTFLEHAWADWVAAGNTGDAFSGCTPMADMSRRVPTSIQGRLGYYSFDSSAPITAGTWSAAYDAAQCALTGADLIAQGERSAFALCRPPGHHARPRTSAAIAISTTRRSRRRSLLDRGRARVAILDVDYHHGNGTQSIFYARSDVLFASIHGDPPRSTLFLGLLPTKPEPAPVPAAHGIFRCRSAAAPSRWFDALEDACKRIRELPTRGADRVARRRHVRARPDLVFQAALAPITSSSGARSRGSACRRCSRSRAATRSTRSAST